MAKGNSQNVCVHNIKCTPAVESKNHSACANVNYLASWREVAATVQIAASCKGL